MTGPISNAYSRTARLIDGNIVYLYLVALLIPLGSGLYWPSYLLHPHLTPVLFRPAVVGIALILWLLWGHLRLTSAETRLLGAVGFLWVMWFGTSLGASDVERALTDWVKLVILCGICLLLSRILRYKATSKAFGHGLIAASMIVGVFIVAFYVRMKGLTIPTYVTARQFKGLASIIGVPLNPVALAGIFSYLSGMCLLRTNAFLLSLGVFLFTVCSVFTGSRAPIGVLIMSLFVLFILRGLRSERLVVRYYSYLVVAVTAIALVLIIWKVPFRAMTEALEGRWDLWYVAVQKIQESPWIGNGFESWRDDLASRMPGVYSLTRTLRTQIQGGYHNEYITVLAEQGILGFLPVIWMSWFLISSCYRLAYDRWKTWENGEWALFTGLFLLLRGLIEAPGLFGYSQEPLDYLAYFFLAIVVSRLSIEEDHAPAVARNSEQLHANLSPQSALMSAS